MSGYVQLHQARHPFLLKAFYEIERKITALSSCWSRRVRIQRHRPSPSKTGSIGVFLVTCLANYSHLWQPLLSEVLVLMQTVYCIGVEHHLLGGRPLAINCATNSLQNNHRILVDLPPSLPTIERGYVQCQNSALHARCSASPRLD